MDDLWAVVPAGGAGTRLWPLSRSSVPKFLLDLTGAGSSLLQTTVARLQPLVDQRVLVVTGEGHRDAVGAQLSQIPSEQILAEPSPRDSMAAIGLAAAVLERRHPDSVLGSFAADHVIGAGEEFAAAVRTAVEVARDGWLVTVGVRPTHAATGFGYLRVGAEVPGHPSARTVPSFVEKPTPEVAQSYLESGEYRWNAGMFVVRPSRLLDLLAEQDPEFAARLRRIAERPASLAEEWERLPRIAVDHAVAEPASRAGAVAMVPGDFAWDDVGDFTALRDLVGGAEPAVLGRPELVRSLDSSGLVVPGGDRLVALVGVQDVVVVETPDALLVTTLARAQEVKRLVADLAGSGRDELT